MFLTESSVAARSNLNLRFNYECLTKQKQKEGRIETERYVCVEVIGAEIQKANLFYLVFGNVASQIQKLIHFSITAQCGRTCAPWHRH